MRRSMLSGFLIALLWNGPASADVIEYTDFEAWSTAAGDFTTIDFTGFPDLTEITYQYEELGVVFPELELIKGYFPKTFVRDGWGLDGVGFIDMDFLSPMTSLSIDHPGTAAFRLYRGDELIYESGFFGGSGTGFFSGIVSDIPFDRAEIWDFSDDYVSIDDLHFGPPIPAPSGVALLAVLLLPRRRRQRSRTSPPMIQY